jgi:cellulose synthase/poly-beta-1,6-N-acetylglucosamine synthase-like glycosyltransferase
MGFVALIFWLCALLLVHTHVTYPLSLELLARLRPPRRGRRAVGATTPRVSLIIAAHNEGAVIAERVRNALESDYPRERLEIIVASDGSTDDTAQLAEEAGADLVLDLPRGGKVAAQNAAVARAHGEILAFSDANSMWEADALRRLVERLGEAEVGYVCGQLRLVGEGGANEEGAYWRYEMRVRERESQLASITAGNGAIYAVRRDAYVVMPGDRGHDLCLPYLMVRRGLRAVYEPAAVATERMAPSVGGEFQRKRRMMNRTWGVLLQDSMLAPRGYGALYAYEMLSHRALRYASPFLHLIAFAANIALLGQGWVYIATFAVQVAVLLAAALADVVPARPFAIARYYVVVTGSILIGLWDRLRSGPAITWDPVEGTR